MAERLPIYDIEEQLVTGLRQTRRLIVSAPTGSGKSTQVPQKWLDYGLLGAGAGAPDETPATAAWLTLFCAQLESSP